MEKTVTLRKVMIQRKQNILEQWLQALAETYPSETAAFLRQKKNRFANPVGFAFKENIEGLLGELLKSEEEADLSPYLDEIVRIRAVQDFTPSDAVSFIFSLKEIVRVDLGQKGIEVSSTELAELEGRLDRLALLAFDNYMRCRERLHEIRVHELKEQIALQRGLSWRQRKEAQKST